MSRLFHFCLVVMAVFLLHCGTQRPWESLSGADANSTPGVYDDAVGSHVLALEMDAGGAQVVLPLNQGSQDVVVALVASSDDSDSVGFTLSGGDDDGANQSLRMPFSKNAENAGDVDAFFRDAERNVLKGTEVMLSDTEPFLIHSLKTGDKQGFKIMNSLSNAGNYEEISAVLRYQGENFDIYVDTRDNVGMADSDLQTLGQSFDSTVSVERDIFGEESDVNGDGRFAVVLSRVVNELGASKGSMVTGFFYALDLFEASKYPVSNEREVIFGCVPDPDGGFGSPVSKSFVFRNILPSVLPHEFQHMINFNQHFFIRGSNAEQGWLNEGLSHLSEDIVTINSEGLIAGYGLENPSRVAGYLAGVANVCITCGTSLDQRGGVYLFLKYLYEQAEQGAFSGVADGISLLSSLVQTSRRGIDNVVTAVFGEGADHALFAELLGEYALAVYLSDTVEDMEEQYQFFGMTLRGNLADNRGTFLNGPAVQVVDELPYTGQINGSGMLYLQIPADLIQGNQGNLSLSVGETAGSVGGYLISGP